MFCLVVEWADGTVDVNGPYTDEPTAKKACALLAEKIRIEEEEADGGETVLRVGEYPGLKLFQMGDDFFRIGDADVENGSDVDEGIDVYVRGMGRPVEVD